MRFQETRLEAEVNLEAAGRFAGELVSGMPQPTLELIPKRIAVFSGTEHELGEGRAVFWDGAVGGDLSHHPNWVNLEDTDTVAVYSHAHYLGFEVKGDTATTTRSRNLSIRSFGGIVVTQGHIDMPYNPAFAAKLVEGTNFTTPLTINSLIRLADHRKRCVATRFSFGRTPLPESTSHVNR